MADVAIKPIRRLLIANRGEIARRVLRTAHDMGIATAVVYADGDAGAPFVREADTAIALNGKTPAQTYLDIDKVLDACRRVDADAVHPGYGFLSENAAFATTVIDAGIRWVGPSPQAIAQMGDKLTSKRLMEAAEVPTLQAIEIKSSAKARAAAEEIGYPVLVKASAGGGGRGMRVVAAAADLDAAIEGARREAGSAFGDDTLFLEHWLTSSRHVEIQVLGDNHGELVHLFERECSIQRRHQKVIEEAPSPAVDADLRARMGEAAVAAARRIGYTSAGTVEFLLQGREFWFLEMNTRLQVEHPVTEEITGLDLVREQLRIAEGEPLGYSQDDLAITGHAMEARLYAEDPDNNFLPSPGTVDVWRPAKGSARFDSGVESGSAVSVEFDPMIAKVIVHAPTRREAAARLARALERTSLQGVRNNRDFLVATLREPAFLAGDTSTDFIDRVAPPRRRRLSGEALSDALIAAVIHAQAGRRAAAKVLGNIRGGWRNSVMPPEQATFKYQGDEFPISYRSRRDGSFHVVTPDAEHDVTVFATGVPDGNVDVEIDARRVQLVVTGRADRWLIHGVDFDVELVELPPLPPPGQVEIKGGLTAPMPGNVLATHVTEGDPVAEGQLLLVLEAMKMQHRITAPFDGAVKELHVSAGEQVENGALLVLLEEAE